MAFESILFKNGNYKLVTEQPEFFVDIHLDKIVDNIVTINDDTVLKHIFYTHLNDPDEIKYRQEVFIDLENTNIFSIIKNYYEKIKRMNGYLSGIENLYEYQRERWLLDSIEIYCEAINTLYEDLSNSNVKSMGFNSLREYLGSYIKSGYFISLVNDTGKLKLELSKIRYLMHIKGTKVVVSRYGSDNDYSDDIENAFEKFREDSGEKKNVNYSHSMGHVEATLLYLVARLYPDEFTELLKYYDKHKDFIDTEISVFNREIKFYLKYINYISKIKSYGLSFSIPEITEDKNNIYSYGGFNLALAEKIKDKTVCNDFNINNDERIIVITGPNNGGKTTFARAFAQIHYLASLGLPVPGKKSRLFLFDKIFTHFEKSEDVNNLRGKLEDDLIRIKYIVENSTDKSIIIINEMLSSTTLNDAIYIGKQIVDNIRKINCICVYVTFVDELTSTGNTVSMVSQVLKDNPEIRTHKIIRRPANGLAYAMALAEKYGITYNMIIRRVKS